MQISIGSAGTLSGPFVTDNPWSRRIQTMLYSNGKGFEDGVKVSESLKGAMGNS